MNVSKLFRIGNTTIEIAPIEETNNIRFTMNNDAVILGWKEANVLSQAILDAAREADPWSFADSSSSNMNQE